MSDPSHLIKTSRNNILSSYPTSDASRYLWNKEDMTWEIVKKICFEFCQSPTTEKLTKLYKIGVRHIFPNTYDKMKVSFAAQFLSRSYAEVLQKCNYTTMAELFLKLDKFFDICNNSLYKRNPNMAPFYNKLDNWLIWLEKDFIDYFENWQCNVQERVKPKLCRAGKYCKCGENN